MARPPFLKNEKVEVVIAPLSIRITTCQYGVTGIEPEINARMFSNADAGSRQLFERAHLSIRQAINASSSTLF